eukprot:scaffold3510_cov326-Prasinococcus_capsulatus_cf.AAC.2
MAPEPLSSRGPPYIDRETELQLASGAVAAPVPISRIAPDGHDACLVAGSLVLTGLEQLTQPWQGTPGSIAQAERGPASWEALTMLHEAWAAATSMPAPADARSLIHGATRAPQAFLARWPRPARRANECGAAPGRRGARRQPLQGCPVRPPAAPRQPPHAPRGLPALLPASAALGGRAPPPRGRRARSGAPVRASGTDWTAPITQPRSQRRRRPRARAGGGAPWACEDFHRLISGPVPLCSAQRRPSHEDPRPLVLPGGRPGREQGAGCQGRVQRVWTHTIPSGATLPGTFPPGSSLRRHMPSEALLHARRRQTRPLGGARPACQRAG